MGKSEPQHSRLSLTGTGVARTCTTLMYFNTRIVHEVLGYIVAAFVHE